jgi:hypothetical protein
MEDIINTYFDRGVYDKVITDDHIKSIKLYNFDISISHNKFNKLDNIQKKSLFPYLKKTDEYEKISVELLIDINSYKDKYLLNYDDMKYYDNKLEILLSNDNITNKYKIDPYNFTRFGNISNLNNISNVISISQEPLYNNDYIKNHKTIEKIGIYILPKASSPGFKNFRSIIKYLKNLFNIYLFLDNTESELDNNDKMFIDGVTEVHYISKSSNIELSKLIHEKKLTILISIYGFYRRKDVILSKPCPLIISYQEPPVIYPKTCYDYNLIDNNLYDILKQYTKIDENMFNFIKIDGFILPIPYYSDYSIIKTPVYDPNCIRIGLITYSPKMSHELVKLVNGIIKINKKIFITIYGYINNDWFKIIFPSEQIKLDRYDNTNPIKLQENILFIDCITYNNHSTALEILKLKIPFIGYSCKNRYHGLFSKSLIKSIKMEKYLLADNIVDYIKLIKLYTFNEELYFKLYKKYIKKLDESNILSDEYYANNLSKTLNSFYDNYKI